MNDAGLVDVFGELSHLVGRRMAHNLIGRIALLNRAVFHDRNPVRQTHGLVEIMGDEHNRFAQHLGKLKWRSREDSNPQPPD